ncbi:serine/threonine-protein kinase Sgk2 [Metarhizium brunneum]
MPLTEQQINVILEYPLNNTLDPFRDKLRDLDEADRSWHNATASIILALVDTGAVLNLGSRGGKETLADNLFPLYPSVRKGSFKREHFRHLIRCIIDKASDIDIWEAVFSIIKSLSALTPPRSSITPTFKGTPVKTSSSRLADSETRDIIKGELFKEIKNYTFRNVKGFYNKFFNPKS